MRIPSDLDGLHFQSASTLLPLISATEKMILDKYTIYIIEACKGKLLSELTSQAK